MKVIIQTLDDKQGYIVTCEDGKFIYPFACRNELGIIVQKQFTLSLILDN